jgi:hypothetical protein
MEHDAPLAGEALVKEVCRRIRLARSYWDAHNNLACRTERDRALKLYATLSQEQKDGIPQVLRVWLRYRSEKYFGEHRTKPGSPRKAKKPGKTETPAITWSRSSAKAAKLAAKNQKKAEEPDNQE